MKLVADNTKNDNKVTKEERMVDYIQSIAVIEEAIEPFKEQKKALKQNYVENGWLTKEEMKMLTKAYKMIKDDVDLDQLLDMVETISKGV
tara:strand:- start:6902 stop:7171 length:270 start_codon:yes stop_codon:yes gene_type:complete